MADVIGSSTIVIDFREEFKHLDVCWQSLVFVCHHILWQWPILRSPADILDVCFFLYWFAHLTSKYSIVDAPTIEGGQSQHSSGSAAKKKATQSRQIRKIAAASDDATPERSSDCRRFSWTRRLMVMSIYRRTWLIFEPFRRLWMINTLHLAWNSTEIHQPRRAKHW